MRRLFLVVGVLALWPAAVVTAQGSTCPPEGWSRARLEALKQEKFAVPDVSARQTLALALSACLGDPDPALRDGIAFEALTAWMRGGQLDQATLVSLRARLLDGLAVSDRDGFVAPFSALVLAEVARTDRVTPWMAAADRDLLVRAAARYLAGVTDYRAFDDRAGFRHGVAHGADLALQLALNPAIAKAGLDQLLAAIAPQVSPDANVAYWAGESDRLARPVVFIAQRNLHSDGEWRTFFAGVANPKPLKSWAAAFASESGIKKRHNVRAFLLSVLATALTSDDPGIRLLAAPARDAIKQVP